MTWLSFGFQNIVLQKHRMPYWPTVRPDQKAALVFTRRGVPIVSRMRNILLSALFQHGVGRGDRVLFMSKTL